MKKIIFYATVGLVLFVAQLTVVPLLPLGFDHVNVWLMAGVFTAATVGFFRGTTLALGLAFLFDLYSAMPFGMIMVATGITFYILYFAQNRFFTNRSLYAIVMLSVIATVIYAAVIFAEAAFFNFSTLRDIGLICRSAAAACLDLGRQILVHIILMSAMLFIFNASNRRFSAAFIDTIKS